MYDLITIVNKNRPPKGESAVGKNEKLKIVFNAEGKDLVTATVSLKDGMTLKEFEEKFVGDNISFRKGDKEILVGKVTIDTSDKNE